MITYYAEPGTPEYDALVLLDMLAPEPSANRSEPTGGSSEATARGASSSPS
ncbi:hypothetical protein ABT009_38565 [Streptomyces sp. NPDC002896]|uniref:hypothetical protein n=1 Tax=Streptomyces sp. NPDC002896 TaxID=3154438 RepID=UPI00332995A7